MTWIQTYTGGVFDYSDMNASRIDIQDIAVALSRIARFAGHTRHFYSVGQHSVLASRWGYQPYALEILMHDSMEAYCIDLPRPLKQLLPGYKEIENEIREVIWRRFDLIDTPDCARSIEAIDLAMLATERRDLLSPCIREWETPMLLPISDKIEPWPPDYAFDQFMDTYQVLANQRAAERCATT